MVMKINRFDAIERFVVGLIECPADTSSRNKFVRVILFFLKYLSFIYRTLMQLRLFLYRKGILRHHTLGCQVISVGNLTVGGTGKTPVVEVFSRELNKQGRKIAILSRGYKKAKPKLLKRMTDRLTFAHLRAEPRVVSDGKKLLLDSEMSGDEPYMLASNLPEAAVLVDKDRVKSGRYAINKLNCDTLILDDGFQYMALKHRLEILLVDKTNPFGNEYVIPRGTLRESIKNVRRADFIFITKSDGKDSEILRARLRRLNPDAEIVECTHSARYLSNVFNSERKNLDYLKGLKVGVVSGIAVPGAFEGELERRGAEIVMKRRFADHHRYSQQEIIDIINRSRKEGAKAILTTEKDAVRFPRLDRCDVPIYFLRVDIEILSGTEDFHQCINRICFRHE